jgi:hypothetical protein
MVRFRYIPKITEASMAFYGNSLHLGVWSTIEPGCGIIAGCLATLRPLFKGFIQTARTLRTGSRVSKYTPSIISNPASVAEASRSRSPADDPLFEVDKLWDDARSASSTSTLLLAEKWRHGQLGAPNNAHSNWDVEASPRSTAEWEHRVFGFLSPLPNVAVKGGNRRGGPTSHVELMFVHGSRRGSCPD